MSIGIDLKKDGTHGCALLFSHVKNCRKGSLLISKERQRKLYPSDRLHCYIENTNLNTLPPHCLGVLVAYSIDPVASNVMRKSWFLGIIIFLHPSCTIIHPIKCVCTTGVPEYFQKHGSTCFSSKVLIFDESRTISLVYLNFIHESMAGGSDGYIESSTLGPDVLFDMKTIPSNVLLEEYRRAKVTINRLYSLIPLSCYKKAYGNPFGDISSLNLRNKRKLETNNIKTLFVKKSKQNTTDGGFAFPYPSGNLLCPPKVTFAFLSHKNAMMILKKGSILLAQYVEFLDDLSLSKSTFDIYYVGKSGIAIEELGEKQYNVITRRSKRKLSASSPQSWMRTGYMHGLWLPCEMLELHNPTLLKMILKRTYGDFGFQRSKKPCLGLNTYIGKKSAAYVRPTPKMSRGSISSSEYYREQFDPTFLPLIYKLINKLSDQAQVFQIVVDPVYDKFLLECYCRNNPKVNTRPNGISSNDSKRFLRHRRFAALSIMTCGNSKTIGFANVAHKDNDYIDSTGHKAGLKVLQSINTECEISRNHSCHFALRHIAKKFLFSGKFSTYTTCGYKTIFDTESNDASIFLRAYFLYNSLGVGIEIPQDKSCYHTFDATSSLHQTTVPIIEDAHEVTFNCSNSFIFAWGNGKSAKRTWLEDHGLESSGNRCTQQDIKDFFQQASPAIQSHMNSMHWL